MARCSAHLAMAVWLGCLVWLAGCNAILGINPPSDHLLDSGTSIHLRADRMLPQSAASPSPRSDAGNDMDAGQESPASPEAHAWAGWRMPNPAATQLANAQTYTVDPDGLVTDEVTHLQWQRSLDDASYAWADAADYCGGLTLHGQGWRLPSRIELLSLIDFTNVASIDLQAFPDTPPERFWSSSRFVGETSSAWGVNFGFGGGFVIKDDLNEMHRVRCVR
jgi:hypothetical protein